MLGLRGGLIAEALCSGVSGKVIETLQVSKNGVYNASAGVDGYSPVIVGVPDRYEEGYADGEKKGKEDAKAELQSKIQSLTVTKNGTYSAASYNLIGFDPVNVKVVDTRIDDVEKFITDFPGDTSDTIGTITGLSPNCTVDGENHTYSYSAMYTDYSDGGQFGSKNAGYKVTVKLYQDGELLQEFNTRIPANSSQDTTFNAGMDNFADNFYLEKNDDSTKVRLRYHYFSLGSWSSYNLMRESSWYDL